MCNWTIFTNTFFRNKTCIFPFGNPPNAPVQLFFLKNVQPLRNHFHADLATKKSQWLQFFLFLSSRRCQFMQDPSQVCWIFLCPTWRGSSWVAENAFYGESLRVSPWHFQSKGLVVDLQGCKPVPVTKCLEWGNKRASLAGVWFQQQGKEVRARMGKDTFYKPHRKFISW